jgi:hypothetical protein
VSADDTITNRHLLEELVTVKTMLGAQGQALRRVEQVLADHEPRLRELEKAGATTPQQASQLADHEDRLRLADKWRHALPPTLVMSALALAGMLLQASGKI